jgi:hypothetical protein
VLSIANAVPSKVIITSLDSAVLRISAPSSHVKLGHLKSLHDTSYVLCESLDLTLSDDFDSCHIYDLRTARFLDPLAIETQTPEP